MFFQGSNDAFQQQEDRAAPAASAPQTQVQILSLLRALNDKLKTTQTERQQMRQELETYRTLVQEIETKSAEKEKTTEERAQQAEKIAQDVMKELRETRKLMLAIEDKAEQADKGFSTLKAQVGQAYKIGDEIAKRQARLEKTHQELAQNGAQGPDYEGLIKRLEQTEKRQDDLGTKIEDALTEQAKIMRQIDKAIEDRARFMRKIERIEETVIQTRDALNARAMVLLTDQAAGAKPASYPGLFPAAPAKSAEARFDAEAAAAGVWTWWKPPAQAQTVAAAAVLLVAILGGWAISQWQQFDMTALPGAEIDYPALADESRLADILRQDDRQSLRALEETQDSMVEESARALSDLEEPAAAAPEKIAPPQESAAPPLPIRAQSSASLAEGDDIGTLDLNDEQKVLAALENNPDALATALNNIEPGRKPAAPVQQLASGDSLTQEERQPIVAPEKTSTQAPKAINDGKMLKADRALPDRVKAIETQAFAGVPEAQHDLAAIYTAGQGGVRQNYERAAFWFEQAAKKGIANARYNLGVLYHQGLGVKSDLKAAIYWYQQAADLGHPEAQYNLGIAYIEGIGVPYEPKKAERFFENAANQGIMEAAYNLGLIYENGLLGSSKPDEALLWYKTAADKGSPEAKAALQQLAKNLGISSDEVNRAVESMRSGKKADAAAPKPSASRVAGNAKASDQDIVAQIQTYLMDAGLYPGPADGTRTPQTEDAIRAYQSLNDLSINGKPSEKLLSHMLANNAPRMR